MVVVDAIANQLLAYFPMTLKEVATSRYYDIHVKNLRQAFTSVMAAYLKRKLDHSQQMSFVEVDVEVTEMVFIILNACMVVIYAKLRSIHTKLQERATIYVSRPTYTKECKLTLPFADVIENFGKYVPHDVTHNIIHVPTYLENTRNEG
nr:putative coat protein [Ipomoea batatas]